MKWYEPIPWILSIAALVVSLIVGWYTAFKPAQIIGDLSYIVIWRFSSNNDGVVTDTAVTPAFWLRNTGAIPVVIKDIQIIFILNDGSRHPVYPISSVPLSAIDNFVEFNEYGRIGTGSPFRSFSLTKYELWTSLYKFSVDTELLHKLVGEVQVRVQISTSDEVKWNTVIMDSLDFGKLPYHMQKMIGSAQTIPVYSQQWRRLLKVVESVERYRELFEHRKAMELDK